MRSSATPPRSCSRTAARCWARCAIRSRPPTSRRSCCRRRLEGQDHRARQCRRRHHQLDQAGAEFGIVKGGQNLAGLLVFITDVQALGLQTAQGLILTEAFYWDLNDANRAVRQALRAADTGRPSDHDPCRRLFGGHALPQGGRGAQERRRRQGGRRQDEGDADRRPLFGKGTVRADGRKIHPMYLFEVKKPEESKGAVGLLQAPRHHPGERGLPAARRGRLPAGEELTDTIAAAVEPFSSARRTG